MPAPTDAARNATQFATAVTTFSINVGSPTAGTLLVVVIRFSSAAPGTTTFTGYTLLAGPDTSDATDDTTAVYWRWADGTEGTTDDLTTTNASKGAAICWQVTGTRNEAPAISTIAVGTTAANSADPSSVAPTGAPQDTLYLAVAAGDGESPQAYTAAPTNYSNFLAFDSSTAGGAATNCYGGGGSRQISASASDNPGVFTHSAHTTGWSAYTIALRGLESTFVPPNHSLMMTLSRR